MLERFVWYAASNLAPAFCCWLGIAAFVMAFRRFGRLLRFPLWIVFIGFWILGTGVGFVFGTVTEQYIFPFAIVILLIGILFWATSLLLLFFWPAAEKDSIPQDNVLPDTEKELDK